MADIKRIIETLAEVLGDSASKITTHISGGDEEDHTTTTTNNTTHTTNNA